MSMLLVFPNYPERVEARDPSYWLAGRREMLLRLECRLSMELEIDIIALGNNAGFQAASVS